MPPPAPQVRASRALRRAISLTPESHPLLPALQSLYNPLTYNAHHTHLDDDVWQTTLNRLTTFAHRVISSFHQQPNLLLDALHLDARNLHTTLDRIGFYSAFHPSHITARSLALLHTCADGSEHTTADMLVVTTSLLATCACLQEVFSTPVTLVDLVGTLSRIAERYRRPTLPAANATVASHRNLDLDALIKSYHSFMRKLCQVTLPDQRRQRIRTFVDMLWEQLPITDSQIYPVDVVSPLHLQDHLGGSRHTVVTKAIFDFTDGSKHLWHTGVALKTIRVLPNFQLSQPTLRRELLRLKVLSHPCIPLFYGAICQPDGTDSSEPQHITLVSEQMTRCLRDALQDVALRRFDARVRILRDVADCLRYLHAQSMLHGSISPSNVLVRVHEGALHGRAKVDVTHFATNVARGTVNTHPLIYSPPERFTGKERYFTGDIWSFGVLACFLLADERTQESDDRYIAATMKGVIADYVYEWAKTINNDSVRKLVNRCLHVKPESRPNAAKVYEDISEILRERWVHVDVPSPAILSTHAPAQSSSATGALPVSTTDVTTAMKNEDILVNTSLPGPCADSTLHTTGNREIVADSPRYKACSTFPDPLQATSQVPCFSGQNGSSSRAKAEPEICGVEQVREDTERPDEETNVTNRDTGKSFVSSDSLTGPSSLQGTEDDIAKTAPSTVSPDHVSRDEAPNSQGTRRTSARQAKRRAVQSNNQNSSNRLKLHESSPVAKVPSRTAEKVRRDTLEEIFGSMLNRDDDALATDRVKSESCLREAEIVASDLQARKNQTGKKRTRVKAEDVMLNGIEVTNIVDSSPPEEDRAPKKLISSKRGRKHAKQEVSIEDDQVSAEESLQGTPRALQREFRKPNGPHPEWNSSSIEGVGNDQEYSRDCEAKDGTPGSVWSGRTRRRPSRGCSSQANYALSPAPSLSSRGPESILSSPSDNTTAESNGSPLSTSIIAKSPKRKRRKSRKSRENIANQTSLKKSNASKKERSIVPSMDVFSRDFSGDRTISLDFLSEGKGAEWSIEAIHKRGREGDASALVQLGILYEEGQHVRCDYGLAFISYQQAAAAGNSEGQLRLGRCYEVGRGVSKNEPAATALFVQAADAQNYRAQLKAGLCFEEGKGIRKDLKKALDYFSQAAEERVPEACFKVAEYCKEGTVGKRDETKAFGLYKIAADAGHLASMVQLANMHAKGIGGAKRSIARAVTLYRRAAEGGDPSAKLSLGLLHEDGHGVKRSCECALQLYQEAAATGYAPAITALGQCYVWGYGVMQDLEKAVLLFTSASQAGDSLASHELGNCYKDGSGVTKDDSRALDYYKLASSRGSPVALVQYGEFLYSGRGIAQCYEKAFEQFKRAADSGAAEGYRWLGDCYTDGTGVMMNLEEAYRMYLKSAELGSTNAQTCLGVCYEHGNGTEQSASRALHWYKKAAGEGNQTALNNLGILYEQGQHVKRDAKRAVSYYQKAIDVGSIDALCNLADCYAGGHGVAQNVEKAVKLYREATKHGVPGAKCELGVCYYYGKGVAQDFEQALKLLREACDSEPEALRHIGTAFYDGKGVDQDFEAAIRLYRQAIARGNTDANFNLALCYSYGKGVPENERVATGLLEKAAKGSNRSAKLYLGNRYFEGRGVERDVQKAVELFLDAGEFDVSQWTAT